MAQLQVAREREGRDSTMQPACWMRQCPASSLNRSLVSINYFQLNGWSAAAWLGAAYNTAGSRDTILCCARLWDWASVLGYPASALGPLGQYTHCMPCTALWPFSWIWPVGPQLASAAEAAPWAPEAEANIRVSLQKCQLDCSQPSSIRLLCPSK